MPRNRLAKCSWAISGRKQAKGVLSGPGSSSSSACSTRTRSKVALPLSVWRWPMLSQSSCRLMPVRPLGMAAISSLPPALSSTAEAINISESLAPEQKLFLPENSYQPSNFFTTVRVSSGLRALPQNQFLRAVCSNQGCHCSGRANRRTVASIRCWKPNTWAMELSTRANSRTTSKVSLQLAPMPPYWLGIARASRPLARSASRSTLGVPPRASRSTALSANCSASRCAVCSGLRRVGC
ncbi:hypothetical protein D3C85_1012400 [compost metagenome]